MKHACHVFPQILKVELGEAEGDFHQEDSDKQPEDGTVQVWLRGLGGF